MSEWFENQKQSISGIHQLLQEPIEKSNRRRKLTSEESKLKAIADILRRGENVRNRKLQRWLSEDEYAHIEAEWRERLALRETLKDKAIDMTTLLTKNISSTTEMHEEALQ
jgi:hypothetical protein